MTFSTPFLAHLITRCLREASRVVLCPSCVGRRQPIPKQALVFKCLQHTSFENTVGKGEIARNEQFLLFPHCLLPIWRTFCHFHQVQRCRLQTLSVWDQVKSVVWERVKHPPLQTAGPTWTKLGPIAKTISKMRLNTINQLSRRDVKLTLYQTTNF